MSSLQDGISDEEIKNVGSSRRGCGARNSNNNNDNHRNGNILYNRLKHLPVG